MIADLIPKSSGSYTFNILIWNKKNPALYEFYIFIEVHLFLLLCRG